MINLFFSQPMTGYTFDQVREERQRMIEGLKINAENPDLPRSKKASDLYRLIRDGWEKNFEIIDQITPNEELSKKGYVPDLVYLGEDIKLMSFADLIVFHNDWPKSKGCCSEHEICFYYKIPYIILDESYHIKHFLSLKNKNDR